MKKLSKVLLNILGCALLLTGCKESEQTSNKKFDDDIIPIEDVVVEPDNQEDEDLILKKTCQEIKNGSIGGALIDLVNDASIEPNYSYDCVFSHKKTFTGKYIVRSDDRTIAQVTHDENTNVFTLKGITPGDAIIQAFTEENEIVLQIVVHVRKRISLENIAERLYKVDKFYGYMGYSLVFLSNDPLKGSVTGHDEFETTYANFTLLDGVEEKISESAEFNTYKFKISVDPESSRTSRTFLDLYVSTTGDIIYIYYSSGSDSRLIDIFLDHPIRLD